ncbi:TIGR03084 family metal-binding protein [Rhodococcus triatomae]|nr:hypothetical protein G419_04805 [Rhodococcus triatomae BKS 15-14]
MIPDPPGTGLSMGVLAALSDLHEEGASLDQVLSGLPTSRWTEPTPAVGWTIAHQIGHLLWTDSAALAAVSDPDRFESCYLKAAAADPHRFVDEGASEYAARPSSETLADWRSTRRQLGEALAALPADIKIPWFGPPMRPASMAAARLMETWAHGKDVADALGITRAPTARLRRIANLGVRTRNFSYINRGLNPPTGEFRVSLTAPPGVSGDPVWVWGPTDAEDEIAGPAEDFCLLVTRRADKADLALTARGAEASRWLDIAQAFAGPPGSARQRTLP